MGQCRHHAIFTGDRSTIAEELRVNSFQMVAVCHIGFSKVRNFNCRSSSEGQYASQCQMPCVIKQTSMSINTVDDTVYSSAIVPLWTWTTVADGHKFSAVRRLGWRLLDQSKKHNFYLRHLHSAPPIGVDAIGISLRSSSASAESPWVTMRHCFHHPMFNHFSTMLACDGQTERHRAIAYTALAKHCMVKSYSSSTWPSFWSMRYDKRNLLCRTMEPTSVSFTLKQTIITSIMLNKQRVHSNMEQAS